MKISRLTFVAMALLFACAARGQTNSTYNSGALNVAIPNGTPVGITEQTSISGLVGVIYNVQVSLDISGGFNGSLYAYLAGPGSQSAILLNRTGVTAGNAFGYADAGFNITLGETGVNIHNYENTINPGGAALTSGSWSADGRAIDPASTPSLFDTAPVTAGLDIFNGYASSGTWTLFLTDISSGGGQSTLVSWGLTVVTVPEPQTWAMIAGGAGMLMVFRRRGIR
jgi:subtilisin-like proprotein convertase family protein